LLNFFQLLASVSSLARSISVSVDQVPVARFDTVEVRFSSVSSGLSLNSTTAAGWAGLQSLPRPCDTRRSPILSTVDGPGHRVDSEISPEVR
jgi:hypothetical protein